MKEGKSLFDIDSESFFGKTESEKEEERIDGIKKSENEDKHAAEVAAKIRKIRIMLHARSFEKAAAMIAKLEEEEEQITGDCCEIPEVYWCKVLLANQARDEEDLVAKHPDIENDENYILAVDFCASDEQKGRYQSIAARIAEAKSKESKLSAQEEREDGGKEEKYGCTEEEPEPNGVRLETGQEKRNAVTAMISILKTACCNGDDFDIKDGVLVKYKGNGGNVVIPDGVTVIGTHAFLNCGSVTRVVIPDSVTTISVWAFMFCASLECIIIPDSVEKIGSGAFCFCDSLHIYCRSGAAKRYWSPNWIDGDNIKVIWGYKGN